MLVLFSGTLASDTFLADSLVGSFFLSEEEEVGHTPSVSAITPLTDSDGFSADEFYVVLDSCYKYCPHDNLDVLIADWIILSAMSHARLCVIQIHYISY